MTNPDVIDKFFTQRIYKKIHGKESQKVNAEVQQYTSYKPQFGVVNGFVGISFLKCMSR
jgi:hypothetical protein